LLFVVRAVGMEPFMELSRTRLDLFRSKEEVECFASAASPPRPAAARQPCSGGASTGICAAPGKDGRLEGPERST
jgi:hypothetical protein